VKVSGSEIRVGNKRIIIKLRENVNAARAYSGGHG
jgi:hypothetical protein